MSTNTVTVDGKKELRAEKKRVPGGTLKLYFQNSSPTFIYLFICGLVNDGARGIVVG
jgi:hypothetical protein